MKIERISENSIRCTLTSFDLSVRDINVKELAYGTDKVKKLFSEMMTRASNEVGFEADGTPIMIEAIPLSGDSIQLVITKVDNPEELDARFSRFSPGPQGANAPKAKGEDWLHRLTSELLEGATGFLAQMQSMQAAQQGGESQTQGKAPAQGRGTKTAPGAQQPVPEDSYRAIGFEGLDPVFDAAAASAFYQGESVLYRKPGTEEYVLMIHGKKENQEDFAKVCNVLAEYGRSIHTTSGTNAYYEEHYEVITSSPAIEKLASIR